MNDIITLIILPFAVACVLLALKSDRARGIVAVVGAAATMIASVAIAWTYAGNPQAFGLCDERINLSMFAIETVLSLAIIYLGIKYKKYAASVLGAIQLVLSVTFVLFFENDVEVENGLYIDDLSVIMVLIIGIVGSLICVYAVGYMRDYQKHAEGKDRRPWFFFLLFTFLSAMFGIVLSNDMAWMFFFWEITTLCSFALIGFTRTDEARNNSFLQLTLNLIGGIAFVLALIVLSDREGTLSLENLLASGGDVAGWLLLSVMLLALAGMVKSAQMPFHTWLLGAMVAPTPTSALLHSSTMVKAGVFILLKLSPLLHGNFGGYMVMAVGGLTFLFASMAAISQSNAKRVLAYSTIANLGLIVACAGVGTPEAAWAGVMLMIFHAVTKSLLFLCVGTAEHHIGSRDIEDMDGLFERMPRLAMIMMVGISAMFLAPFGMLVSKWAALVSFVDPSNPISILLIGCIAFGSAVTGLYWTKWLAKLSFAARGEENIEKTVWPHEWVVLGALAVMAIGICFGYPLMSDSLVGPWTEYAFSCILDMQVLDSTNVILLLIMVCALILIFLPFFGRGRTEKASVYMSGAGIDDRSYDGSMGAPVSVTLRNWYLDGWFGEDRIRVVGRVCTIVALVACFAAILLEVM